MNNFPKRKPIHLDFSYRDGYVYFVTICCSNKKWHFDNPEICRFITKDLLKRQDEMRQIFIYCYCIMPDHFHLLFELSDGSMTLQKWVSSFKSYSAKQAKTMFNIDRLWHVNFYDHVVRTNESLYALSQYILYNPVRAELVDDWRAWPYSYLNGQGR